MLYGKRIILRTLRDADLDLLYDLSADLRHMGDYWPLGMPSEIRSKNRLRETGRWEEDHGSLYCPPGLVQETRPMSRVNIPQLPDAPWGLIPYTVADTERTHRRSDRNADSHCG